MNKHSVMLLKRLGRKAFPASLASSSLFCSNGGAHADQPDFISRERYILPAGFERKDWFPKHMGIQLKVMEGKLRTVDLILEVHDARVAITGRNPNFATKLYAIRPHILILNKMDLVDLKRYKGPIEDYYAQNGVKNIHWTDCTKRVHSQWDELRRKMLDLLTQEHRFNRAVKTEYQIMVVGIPNVGKSSLINCLRKNNLGYQRALKEGPFPGVTVRVQNRVRIWDRPPIYILDTPGVLNPWVHTVDEAMKLAVCNLILESSTKPYFVADYLLYYMNKYRDFSYMNLLKMDGPSDDIKQVLINYCQLHNLRFKSDLFTNKLNWDGEVWDIHSAANGFLSMFREGHFRDNFLDRDLLGFNDSSAHIRPRERRRINRNKFY